MKYFIDTEFIEGFHKPLFGKRRHFIDLISIGIVCEDGREYYAISKEFDLKRAWNEYQIEIGKVPCHNPSVNTSVSLAYSKAPREKVYWLRNNILHPLIFDILYRYSHGDNRNRDLDSIESKGYLGALTYLIEKYGKSNAQIAEEIKAFCKPGYKGIDAQAKNNIWPGGQIRYGGIPEFYAYYADYDWVLFCSLFGKMIDLPEGFPMYCKDLKQMLDEAQDKVYHYYAKIKSDNGKVGIGSYAEAFEEIRKNSSASLKLSKGYPSEPKHTHNALEDARWNKALFEYLEAEGYQPSVTAQKQK